MALRAPECWPPGCWAANFEILSLPMPQTVLHGWVPMSTSAKSFLCTLVATSCPTGNMHTVAGCSPIGCGGRSFFRLAFQCARVQSHHRGWPSTARPSPPPSRCNEKNSVTSCISQPAQPVPRLHASPPFVRRWPRIAEMFEMVLLSQVQRRIGDYMRLQETRNSRICRIDDDWPPMTAGPG